MSAMVSQITGVSIVCSNKKFQDYVYIKWEYWNTMEEIKHYQRHENKINENKVLYCKA